MLKPPRPGSFCDSTLRPPPPSCSPFSGKSSSNMNTESYEGGNGSGCVSTVSGLAVVGNEQVVAGGVMVHWTGAPLMQCPQEPGSVARATPVVQSADSVTFTNGSRSLPGMTV